jgi:hypothetical protein
MSRKNYRHNTMDALIGKPLYSNLSGTGSSTVVDVIGGGTFDGSVYTPPTNAGNTGVNTTPTLASRTASTPIYFGTDEETRYIPTQAPPILPKLVDEEPRPTIPPILPKLVDEEPRPTTPTIPPTAPIIPIIVTPTPIISPMPLISGGFGGGGGASSSAQKVVEEKPNFIKKNILPILLVGSAIYVIIKKPI